MAKCVDGSPNSGTITFQELESDRTRVTATIEYEPEGFLEKTADALRIPSGRVEGDLERFPDFIQERGRESGGWRGEIGRGESRDLGATSETGKKEGFRSAQGSISLLKATFPREWLRLNHQRRQVKATLRFLFRRKR